MSSADHYILRGPLSLSTETMIIVDIDLSLFRPILQ